MFEMRLGLFRRKIIEFDGYTLNLGKTTLDLNDIKQIIYEEPTRTRLGSLCFSTTDENVSSLKERFKYTLYFDKNDNDNILALIRLFREKNINVLTF